MPIELPTQAPDFTLNHVLGHSVSLSDFRGKKVVLVLGGTRTAGQLKEGILAIRRSLGPDQVAIVSVADLRAVPRPARVVAKGRLKKAYNDAVSEAAALQGDGADPSINMLTDWSGTVIDQFGVNVDEEAIAIAIDEQGQVIGSGRGSQLGSGILAALSSR